VAQQAVDDGRGIDPALVFSGLPEVPEFLVGSHATVAEDGPHSPVD
jgi:hypothetical protein